MAHSQRYKRKGSYFAQGRYSGVSFQQLTCLRCLPFPVVSRVQVYNDQPHLGRPLGRRRILVADEDPKVVAFIIETLRQDGHAVFHAHDGLSAAELAFAIDEVHLVITNTRVSGTPGIELVYLLRTRLPNLPIMYIANIDRSISAIEAKLPRDVPILREPFTADQLRELVGSLLSRKPGLLDIGR